MPNTPYITSTVMQTNQCTESTNKTEGGRRGVWVGMGVVWGMGGWVTTARMSVNQGGPTQIPDSQPSSRSEGQCGKAPQCGSLGHPVDGQRLHHVASPGGFRSGPSRVPVGSNDGRESAHSTLVLPCSRPPRRTLYRPLQRSLTALTWSH